MYALDLFGGCMEILLILLGLITAIFDLSVDEFFSGLSFIFEFF